MALAKKGGNERDLMFFVSSTAANLDADFLQFEM